MPPRPTLPTPDLLRIPRARTMSAHDAVTVKMQPATKNAIADIPDAGCDRLGSEALTARLVRHSSVPTIALRRRAGADIRWLQHRAAAWAAARAAARAYACFCAWVISKTVAPAWACSMLRGKSHGQLQELLHNYDQNAKRNGTFGWWRRGRHLSPREDVHVHMPWHIHACHDTCAPTCIRTCKHVRMSWYMHANRHMNFCASRHMHACVHADMPLAYMHARLHVYMQICRLHTCMHCMHTHLCTCQLHAKNCVGGHAKQQHACVRASLDGTAVIASSHACAPEHAPCP
eukprot:363761-Chlamydomonas_euryale.AAC.9